jgi:hypothetical protein
MMLYSAPPRIYCSRMSHCKFQGAGHAVGELCVSGHRRGRSSFSMMLNQDAAATSVDICAGDRSNSICSFQPVRDLSTISTYALSLVYLIADKRSWPRSRYPLGDPPLDAVNLPSFSASSLFGESAMACMQYQTLGDLRI